MNLSKASNAEKLTICKKYFIGKLRSGYQIGFCMCELFSVFGTAEKSAPVPSLLPSEI